MYVFVTLLGHSFVANPSLAVNKLKLKFTNILQKFYKIIQKFTKFKYCKVFTKFKFKFTLT